MDKVQFINDIIRSFKIRASCVAYKKVRNISFYDLKLDPGTLVKTIDKFSNEIALALRARAKPFIRTIPSEGIVRLEVVDEAPQKINFFSEVSKLEKMAGGLPMWLGSAVDGGDIWIDAAKNPHTLIAGTTGSGKTTLLHTMIANSLRNNTAVYLIDTKNIEFSAYTNKINNLVMANTYIDALNMLKFLFLEMESRYASMRKSMSNEGVKKPPSSLLFIIDEFADLIMQDDNNQFAGLLCRLAQKCRASNIHCVLATQRPSSDIISGSVKANFPARIACQVASVIDSKVVLDCSGAERLSGNGDAIIKNYNNDYVRFQVAYSSPEEVIANYAA